MSNFDFINIDALERATEQARKALGSEQGLNYGAGSVGLDPNGLPFDPSYSAVNVDISQYLRPDGSYDIDAYLSEVFSKDTIMNLTAYDPGNPNAYIAIAGELSQIFQPNVWNSLSGSQQQYVNDYLGNMLTNPNDGNVSLIDVVATTLVGTFWNHDTNPNDPIATREEQTKAFIQSFMGRFGGNSGNSPWVQNLLADLQDYNQNFDSSFLSTYGQLSPNDFNFAMKLDGEAILLADGVAGNYEDHFNHMEILEAEKNTHDPFELFLALLAILYDQNDDMQIQEGGLGNTLNNLMPKLLNQSTDLLQSWQAGAGSFTGASLQTFLSKIQNLHFAFQDKLVSSGQSSVNDAYNAFFDPNSDNTMKFNPPVSVDGVSCSTIAQGYQVASSSADPNSAFTDLANGINSQFGPNTSSAAPSVPPQYTQGISLFSGCESACQSVSSTTTQQLQTQQGVSDKFLQLIGSCISLCWDAVKVMTQNQTAAPG